MKSKMKLMPLLVSVTLISGCTVLPGSNMSTMGKDVIKLMTDIPREIVFAVVNIVFDIALFELSKAGQRRAQIYGKYFSKIFER